MTPIVLYRIDPAQNMHRYYYLDIQADLFGNLCVIRTYGRIGRSGQTCSTAYPTEDEAQAALQKQCQAKVSKGYVAPCTGFPLLLHKNFPRLCHCPTGLIVP